MVTFENRFGGKVESRFDVNRKTGLFLDQPEDLFN